MKEVFLSQPLTQNGLLNKLNYGHWAKDKKVNMYTNCRYASAAFHVCGMLHKEGEILTDEGKQIKNRDEILQLSTNWKPKNAMNIHCKLLDI